MRPTRIELMAEYFAIADRLWPLTTAYDRLR